MAELTELCHKAYNQQAVCILDFKGGQEPKTALQTSVQPRAGLEAITPEGYLLQDFYSKSNWCWLAYRKGHCSKPQLNSCRQYWFQTFPYRQFHVLFNSLFKVLFIFPSRYLFAIGLSPLFSFRWYLPPILDSNPKLSDSLETYHTGTDTRSKRDSHPLWCCFPTDLDLGRPRKRSSKLQFALGTSEISKLSFSRFTRRY